MGHDHSAAADGDPEDLKGVVLLLASPTGAFITGAALVVDGGVAV